MEVTLEIHQGSFVMTDAVGNTRTCSIERWPITSVAGVLECDDKGMVPFSWPAEDKMVLGGRSMEPLTECDAEGEGQ